MQVYLDALRTIQSKGKDKPSVQGVPARTYPGTQMRFDMSGDSFPLLTVRDLSQSWKAVVCELIWFLSGSTNAKDLEAMGVKFWGQWAYEPGDRPYEAQGGYVRKWREMIARGEELPEHLVTYAQDYEEGDAGPIYGHQWRHFQSARGPIDQISELLARIKKDPNDRRHMVTSWNPSELDNAFLVPCHGIFHLVWDGEQLHLVHFQRSGDFPVGLPFNIASYALLHRMICQVVKLPPGELIMNCSDSHIYHNQMENLPELLSREPRPLPRLSINPNIDDIFAFRFEDFALANYNPHPRMKFPVLL